MRRRNSSFFEDLVKVPWPVGLAFGVGVVLLGKVVIPSMLLGAENPFLSAFGKQLATNALDPLIWMLAALCWLAAFLSVLGGRPRRRLLDAQSGLNSLRAMNWRELEHLVSEAYRRSGFQVEENGQRGTDGGVDLILRRDGQLTLVQCKQWRTQRVGAPIIREQFGLLTHHRAAATIIVTTGDFTPEARAFAEGKPIDLIAGPELLALVQSVQREPRPQPPTPSPPSAVAASPLNCPKCGAPMVKRKARQTESLFLGCSTFPACRGTRPI